MKQFKLLCLPSKSDKKSFNEYIKTFEKETGFKISREKCENDHITIYNIEKNKNIIYVYFENECDFINFLEGIKTVGEMFL